MNGDDADQFGLSWSMSGYIRHDPKFNSLHYSLSCVGERTHKVGTKHTQFSVSNRQDKIFKRRNVL